MDYSKLTWKDITPTNIKAFVLGYFRSWTVTLYNEHFRWVEERAKYREEQVAIKSPECLNHGSCKHCGCTIPELFYADKACSATPPCYEAINSKDEWVEFKTIQSLIQAQQKMATPKINIIETQKTTPQKNVVEVKLPTEVETATIATPPSTPQNPLNTPAPAPRR